MAHLAAFASPLFQLRDNWSEFSEGPRPEARDTTAAGLDRWASPMSRSAYRIAVDTRSKQRICGVGSPGGGSLYSSSYYSG